MGEPIVDINSVRINGVAGEQIVAVRARNRKYLAVYSQSGTCVISVGDGTHTDLAVSLAQGNLYTIPAASQVTYTGASTQLVVMQDRGSNTVLTSDNKVLTSDGYTLYYNARHKLLPPVFG